MNRSAFAALLVLCLVVRAPARAEDAPAVKAPTIEITRNGTQPSAGGSAANFVGSVRVDPLSAPHDPSRISVGSVTFEPGARTAWHSHPAGQILIITAGVGWVQQWGGPVEEIRPGDVVWIPPGVKHWHGASATNRMTHLAIQEMAGGRNVDWMEPVSGEQYQR
jgi:quercetin dioxygenase-like cupin family protein